LSQSLLNRPTPSGFAQSDDADAYILESGVLGPEESAGGRYLLGVWILVAVVTPLVGFLGARGVAPEVGFAGLLCLPLVRLRRADLVGLLLFGLLAAWALVSATWSPAPAPSDFKSISRFTGLHLAQELLFSGALIVTARTLAPHLARKALIWLAGGLIALVVVLIGEAFSGAALFRTLQPLIGKQVPADWALRSVAQGGYVLAMLFWPVTVGLWTGGRPYVGAVFAAGAMVTLGVMGVSAPAMALAVGTAVFGLVVWLGRPAAIAGMVVAAAQTLAAPWLMRALAEDGLFHSLRARLPASWGARVDIWTFTSARMAEKPLIGWGLDASRMFKGHIPLHPHDAALQLWFELGAVGGVLGALIWAFIFGRFARAAPDRRLYAATGCATAASALVIGAFSFSLWQEWWICLIALGFAACAVLARQMDSVHA
jgi:O-antigen ligase